MKRAKTFNTVLYQFLKHTVGLYFRFFYPVRITNPEILKELKPPYLLLPNHIMKWDAVILQIRFPHALHCVASESHFRKNWVGFLFSLLGVFPKAKAKSDMTPIRHMMDLKSRNKVICVFPEGQMSWDGADLPMIWSTAKLIKLLKLPVYMPKFSGGNAVQPRWAKGRRKGPMELTIHTLFEDSAAYKNLSPEDIFQKMTEIHSYNDLDTIREHQWTYASGERAEYLENILYICPECRSIATLVSNGNRLSCSSCSLEAELEGDYSFRYREDNEASYPENPYQWNMFQKDILPALWKEYRDSDLTAPFMQDSRILIKTGFRMDPLKIWTEEGDLALFKDHLMLRPAKGDMRLIPFEEISAVHVMTRQKLEFYHDKTLYVFFFPSLRISGYKWLCVLRQMGVPSSYAWHGEEVEEI